MSDEQSYVDLIKQKVLYRQRQGGEVGMMLDYSDVNKIVNEEMARLNVMLLGTFDSWRGNWKGLLNDVIVHCEMQMMGLEGYSREQAIRMKGEVAKEEGMQQQKSGLLGLFSGNNK